MARMMKARPTIGPTAMPIILVLAFSFSENAAWDDRVTVEDAVSDEYDDDAEVFNEYLPVVDDDPEENDEESPAGSDSLEENDEELPTVDDAPGSDVTGGVR
jgi:hypothetical protein